MAAITAELTVISSADATTGWSGSSGGLDDEVYKQDGTGTGGAYTYQTGKNGIEGCTFTPATNINMTANYTSPHLYWTMRCDVFPFCEALNTGATNSGLMVRVTDGSGNYKQWHVAGSDTWDGSWKTYVLDLTSTASHSSSGTLSLADVDVITWYTDNSNSGTIRIIDNTWLDAVRYGDGLQAESATTEALDFTDIADDDGLVANYYGVLQEADGVLFCQGGLVLGDSAGSADCNFVSSGEAVYFRDQLVGSDHYRIEAVEGTGQTDIGITALVCKTIGGTGAELDFSDTGLTSFELNSCTFIDMGSMDFYVGSITGTNFSGCGATDLGNSGFTASSCVWTLCGLITQSGATVEDCLISESTASASVLSAELDLITGTSFVSDGSNHAVELSTIGDGLMEWDNTLEAYAAGVSASPVTPTSTGNEAIYVNVGSGTLTINVATGATIPSIRSAGATVNVVAGQVTTTITVVDIDDGLAIEDANVYLIAGAGGPLTEGDVIIGTSTLTNASGIVTDTRSLASDQPVVGRARRASTGFGTLYKTSPIAGTISSASGLSITVQMIKDE